MNTCPPGHICLKHSNLVIVTLMCFTIFVVYVFQPTQLSKQPQPQTQTPPPTNTNYQENNNSDEEKELRKEKLRQEIIKIKEESRMLVPSSRQYMNEKAHERIINPLLPPERSYEATYGVPINIPTRGPEGAYQQIGYLYKDDIADETKQIGNNTEPVMLPLYGRPTYNGSNKWMYYISSDKYHSIKMPIQHKNKKCDSEYGCDEIYEDDSVNVPAYNGEFKVKIYEYDAPKYIPYYY
jgi:hypothetical protein